MRSQTSEVFFYTAPVFTVLVFPGSLRVAGPNVGSTRKLVLHMATSNVPPSGLAKARSFSVVCYWPDFRSGLSRSHYTLGAAAANRMRDSGRGFTYLSLLVICLTAGFDCHERPWDWDRLRIEIR